MKKEVKGKSKHVYSVVNSINTFNLADTKELSNPYNNKRSPADICKTTSSTYYCADQYFVSNQISHSSDCATSYTIDVVILKWRKSSIGLFFYRLFRGSIHSGKCCKNPVISGITTLFSFSNIDPNHPSVKTSTQSQTSTSLPKIQLNLKVST